MNGANPLDWTATPFLILYGVLYLAAILTGYAIAEWLRPAGNNTIVMDEDELAYLSKGHDRLAETVVSRLMARGAMQAEGSKLVALPGHAGSTMAERELLTGAEPKRWRKVMSATAGFAGDIERGLVNRGLMMGQGEALQIGLFAGLPLLFLLALGYWKYEVGVARDKPVGFLIAFMIITGITFLARWWGTKRHTQAGKAAVKDARARSGRLRMAPTGQETGMAVALFGTGVLATSPLGDLHRLRASSGDSGSGGDGDGDGGCGGGCGGCG